MASSLSSDSSSHRRKRHHRSRRDRDNKDSLKIRKKSKSHSHTKRRRKHHRYSSDSDSYSFSSLSDSSRLVPFQFDSITELIQFTIHEFYVSISQPETVYSYFYLCLGCFCLGIGIVEWNMLII